MCKSSKNKKVANRAPLQVRLLVGVLSAMPCALPAGTITQPITDIQYNASSGVTYFVGPTRWGDPECASATYVRIAPDLLGRKEMLAIALTAKAFGTPVRFSGSCNPDPRYFDAFYVVAEG